MVFILMQQALIRKAIECTPLISDVSKI